MITREPFQTNVLFSIFGRIGRAGCMTFESLLFMFGIPFSRRSIHEWFKQMYTASIKTLPLVTIVGTFTSLTAACCANEPSVPQHATNARGGNTRVDAATARRISSTSGERPLIRLRCRACDLEKSVEKKSRAAFSLSGPAASETRESISRSRAGSVTDPPFSRFASATSRETERRSRNSFTSSSSILSIFFLASPRSAIFFSCIYSVFSGHFTKSERRAP